jgi:glycosyltransferase involved in cell wall biosynthesis
MPLAPRERSELLELERKMYDEAAHVFVMGGPSQDSLIGDYGVDDARISVVGGGLSFDGLPPPAKPRGDPTILFVGREFERKGGDDLVRAFERVRSEVPKAELHLVGISGRFDVPGVVVHGKIADRERLAGLYRAARVFCLPSRYEPYGLVLIEAMAHGVPCIGTRVQAIPEILDDGRAGVLVPPGDPSSLAEAISSLLTDDELARKIGAAGRRHAAENLTWDAVAGRVAPILTRLTTASAATNSD